MGLRQLAPVSITISFWVEDLRLRASVMFPTPDSYPPLTTSFHSTPQSHASWLKSLKPPRGGCMLGDARQAPDLSAYNP